ncbi:MAG: carbohydrate kinase family protein [Candidatus Lokiarchaeota archaeon]|nr:carbohydrate kinase family protein [Candidatus Lokiarchaeota archaeon]
MDRNPYKPIHKYDVTYQAVQSYLNHTEYMKKNAVKKTVFLGFDGYVDLIYSLVASRESPETWKRMTTMKQFGERILNTAGSSCNIERVLKKKIAGGFAPNMARALENLGLKIILAASMGTPEIAPLFREFSHNVRLISIQNHGTTIGLEFDDGKVMMTDFGSINSLTWDKILEAVPREEFIGLIEQCDAIGQGHWALVPDMNSFWKSMIDEIFPNISNAKQRIFMVDVADVSKRSDNDILEMLQLLHKVDEIMPVVLSMNDLETIAISKVLSRNSEKFGKNSLEAIENRQDFYDIGERMNKLLDLSYLTSHDPHFTTITTREHHYWVTEGFTAHPNFTTAAGDHYNAGVLLGLVCGLHPYESLVLGNAVTAIFVRTGYSPSIEQTNKFITNYFHYVSMDDNTFNLDIE